MCHLHSGLVDQFDRTTLGGRPVIAPAPDHQFLAGLRPQNFEMLSNDVLKQILGRRYVEKKRGWSRDFISQATFNLELHANDDPATPISK